MCCICALVPWVSKLLQAWALMGPTGLNCNCKVLVLPGSQRHVHNQTGVQVPVGLCCCWPQVPLHYASRDACAASAAGPSTWFSVWHLVHYMSCQLKCIVSRLHVAWCAMCFLLAELSLSIGRGGCGGHLAKVKELRAHTPPGKSEGIACTHLAWQNLPAKQLHIAHSRCP